MKLYQIAKSKYQNDNAKIKKDRLRTLLLSGRSCWLEASLLAFWWQIVLFEF